MTFEWPAMLTGIAVIPLLALLYAAQRRRARHLLQAHTGLERAGTESRVAGAYSQRLAWGSILIGICAVTLGMARPQASVQVPRIESTVIMAFDVSGSMAADDVKPTRMEAAKEAARALVAEQPAGVRIGVVAFSDRGFSVEAAEYDRDRILAAINRLSPQRGTSLSEAILASLDAIAALEPAETQYYSALTPVPTMTPTSVPAGKHSSASIVLFSDGENTERADPMAAAQAAADRGVRIYTVGLGTPGGANLEIEGFTIRTRLDEQALKQMARISGGAYFQAPSEEELKGIFKALESELTLRREPTELTAIFGGMGLLFLLGGAIMSLLASGRVA